MDRYCVHAEIVDDEGEWYKVREVDKRIKELEEEITRLRKILKGRCTQEEWEDVRRMR